MQSGGKIVDAYRGTNCAMEESNQSNEDLSLLENRLRLMNQYNFAYSVAGGLTSEDQARFVNGEMTVAEASTFARLCRYLIDSLTNRIGSR